MNDRAHDDVDASQERSTPGDPTQATQPTQTQLYDDLRRIFQLEDEKQRIQNEINDRTERLRTALPHLDQGSLMYQMLAGAIGKPKKAAAPSRDQATLPTVSSKPAKRKKKTAKKRTAGPKTAKPAKPTE